MRIVTRISREPKGWMLHLFIKIPLIQIFKDTIKSEPNTPSEES